MARRLTAAKGILRSGQGDKETVDFARENDAKNEYGAYEFVILIDVANMARTRDPSQIAPAYEKIVKLDELGMQDPIVKRQLYFIAAMWASHNLKKPEAARKYAKAALAVGVVNPAWKTELEKITNG
jgi:hypothetical protein